MHLKSAICAEEDLITGLWGVGEGVPGRLKSLGIGPPCDALTKWFYPPN